MDAGNHPGMWMRVIPGDMDTVNHPGMWRFLSRGVDAVTHPGVWMRLIIRGCGCG
ncbi:MAG: hypothetical protein AAF630_11745 [Cyanobacteria bacterium P01_C01_bin.38]